MVTRAPASTYTAATRPGVLGATWELAGETNSPVGSRLESVTCAPSFFSAAAVGAGAFGGAGWASVATSAGSAAAGVGVGVAAASFGLIVSAGGGQHQGQGRGEREALRVSFRALLGEDLGLQGSDRGPDVQLGQVTVQGAVHHRPAGGGEGGLRRLQVERRRLLRPVELEALGVLGLGRGELLLGERQVLLRRLAARAAPGGRPPAPGAWPRPGRSPPGAGAPGRRPPWPRSRRCRRSASSA